MPFTDMAGRVSRRFQMFGNSQIFRFKKQFVVRTKELLLRSTDVSDPILSIGRNDTTLESAPNPIGYAGPRRIQARLDALGQRFGVKSQLFLSCLLMVYEMTVP